MTKLRDLGLWEYRIVSAAEVEGRETYSGSDCCWYPDRGAMRADFAPASYRRVDGTVLKPRARILEQSIVLLQS